jgi:hypothetical protein
MKAHVAEKSSEHQRGVINGNIMLLRRRMYGRGMMLCKPAVHFSQLKMFGGPMDIDEFRKHNTADMGPVNQNIQTESKQKDVVQVVPIQASQNVNTTNGKMWEINSVMVNNQPLRLRREKPLQRDRNNLASMLGLKKAGG